MYVLIPLLSHCCGYLFRDKDQAKLLLNGALKNKTENEMDFWFIDDVKKSLHIGTEVQNREELIPEIAKVSEKFKTNGKMELLDRRKVSRSNNFPLVCTYQINKDHSVSLLKK